MPVDTFGQGQSDQVRFCRLRPNPSLRSQHKNTNTKYLTHPLSVDLDFRVVLHMDIKGLVSKPSTSASVTGLTCPFELPGNGV